MARGTADCTVSTRPERTVDELCHCVAGVGARVGNMFREKVPTVIPRGCDVLIGAFEERYVLLVPIVILVIPPVLAAKLLDLVQYGGGFLR